MTATPSDPTSASPGNQSDAAAQIPITLTFEDRMELLWRRHRTTLIAGCVVGLLAIVGMGAWEHRAKQKELEIGKAYAASSTSEALKAFADSHPGHSLAGAAYLRLADEAFAANKTADALANYGKAAEIFKDGPLAARTKLGLAVTKLVGGKAGEGATGLKELAEDTNQFKGIRAEAAYHLASLAAESGVSSDVVKYSDLLMQIDPSSAWSQRALALRAALPPSAVTSEVKADVTPAAPSIQFGPSKK